MRRSRRGSRSCRSWVSIRGTGGGVVLGGQDEQRDLHAPSDCDWPCVAQQREQRPRGHHGIMIGEALPRKPFLRLHGAGVRADGRRGAGISRRTPQDPSVHTELRRRGPAASRVGSGRRLPPAAGTPAIEAHTWEVARRRYLSRSGRGFARPPRASGRSSEPRAFRRARSRAALDRAPAADGADHSQAPARTRAFRDVLGRRAEHRDTAGAAARLLVVGHGRHQISRGGAAVRRASRRLVVRSQHGGPGANRRLGRRGGPLCAGRLRACLRQFACGGHAPGSPSPMSMRSGGYSGVITAA